MTEEVTAAAVAAAAVVADTMIAGTSLLIDFFKSVYYYLTLFSHPTQRQ
jgi:hypothetical protein